VIAACDGCIDAGVLAGDATDVAHVLLALVQGLASQESAAGSATRPRRSSGAGSLRSRWRSGGLAAPTRDVRRADRLARPRSSQENVGATIVGVSRAAPTPCPAANTVIRKSDGSGSRSCCTTQRSTALGVRTPSRLIMPHFSTPRPTEFVQRSRPTSASHATASPRPSHSPLHVVARDFRLQRAETALALDEEVDRVLLLVPVVMITQSAPQPGAVAWSSPTARSPAPRSSRAPASRNFERIRHGLPLRSTMILAWRSGLFSSSNAPATPSSPTRPVTSDETSIRPSAR